MKEIAYEGDKTKVSSGAGRGETFAAVLARRLSRRGVLKGAAAASAAAVTGPRLFAGTAAQEATPAAGVNGATPGRLLVADHAPAEPPSGSGRTADREHVHDLVRPA